MIATNKGSSTIIPRGFIDGTTASLLYRMNQQGRMAPLHRVLAATRMEFCFQLKVFRRKSPVGRKPTICFCVGLLLDPTFVRKGANFKNGANLLLLLEPLFVNRL